MNATINSLRREYALAFSRFLDDGDEVARRSAYELGRNAVAEGVGLLELALVHHEVLVAHLEQSRENAPQATHAAAEFLLEALSAYEMVRRGFGEAVDAMALERRHAALVRQLSTLLADTSLAFHSRSAVKEMLQLVAEQARELTRAGCAFIQAEIGSHDSLSVTSGSSAAGYSLPLPGDAIAGLVESPDRVRRLHTGTGAQPSEIVAAALTALDGRVIGVIAIGGDGGETAFSELDEAVLVHLAQMAAAALERAARYV